MTKITLPGYIYVDLEHPLVAWEVYRGALISSYTDASNKAQHTSMRIAGIIYCRNNVNLTNELLFENIRSLYFPNAVSRLKCLYAFADEHSAKKAAFWNENDENHFRSTNLIAVGIGADTITKADSDWITRAKREKNGLICQDYIPCIKKYWSEEPYSNDPHWELLVDGYALVWGTDHRNQAYKLIKEKMPGTLGLLELSRIAESMGFYLGHIRPQIYRIGEINFKLKYIMDVHDINKNYKNFIEEFEKYKGPINRYDGKDLFNEKGGLQFTVPDLQEYERDFTLSNQSLYGFSNLKIHAN